MNRGSTIKLLGEGIQPHPDQFFYAKQKSDYYLFCTLKFGNFSSNLKKILLENCIYDSHAPFMLINFFYKIWKWKTKTSLNGCSVKHTCIYKIILETNLRCARSKCLWKVIFLFTTKD